MRLDQLPRSDNVEDRRGQGGGYGPGGGGRKVRATSVPYRWDQEEPDVLHEPGMDMKIGPPEPRRRPAPVCTLGAVFNHR